MKKFIYLCSMMLLSMNMLAQIDLDDKNWKCSLYEDFSIAGRTWNPYSFKSSDRLWRAYPGSGVTHGSEKQVYQFTQCRFNDIDETMELVAEYDALGRIHDTNYYLPSWMWISNNGPGYPSSNGLYYFSGEIDYVNRQPRTPEKGIFQYGYFEIRCKLPTHQGAFPAFWLQAADHDSNDDKFYEEIDIFEYSWWITDPIGPNHNTPGLGSNRCYTSGIYHNLTGQSPDMDNESFARIYYNLPSSSSDLDDWHVYSCEWMPDHVYWFFDGLLVNSYTRQQHIPCHPLILKTNYAIDGYYNHGNTIWEGPGTMTIDYINVYQLKWDCNTDETIACQSDLDDFDYAVKKTVSITSAVNEPIVSSSDKVTFRVTDSFEITGSFEVQQEGEFTVIQQTCPDDNNNITNKTTNANSN